MIANRPPEAPGAMPEVSEVFEIPGNKNLDADSRLARTTQIYRPFNHALEAHLDRRAAAGRKTAVISIHSFTRVYKEKRREVDLGLLFDRDAWLAQHIDPVRFPDVSVKLNEPYGPKDGVMHLLNLHAAPRGLHHLMIEICNDLIESERNQQLWAQRLSVPLIQAAKQTWRGILMSNGMLTLDELRAEVKAGTIDTAVCGAALVDMQGRLIGKRFHAGYFVDGGYEETHGCNYLLGVDIEMEPVLSATRPRPGKRAMAISC